jgi:signal transduction histidine kinase
MRGLTGQETPLPLATGPQDPLRFERLISDISACFIGVPSAEVETVFPDCLRRIVEAMSIDRCTLSQFVADSGHFHVRYSWALPGVVRVPSSFSSRMFPWVLQRVKAGRPIVFDCLDDLPPEAATDRESYRSIGLGAHVGQPIMIGGEFFGLLGFGCVRRKRSWSAETLERTRILAELFANVLARASAERARQAAELQAKEDRAALQHMTRVSMMGQMSASIAHQLNQPLAAILGNAEAARKMLGREPVDLAELREICDDIIAEDNRAAEVIRRLGALFKRGEMRLQPLDLNELVLETLALVRTELLSRAVMPVTDLAADLPAIAGGRVQLQQVLLNLILNAADAMSGIGAADRTVTIRTEAAGTDVRCCVIDHGVGIAQEDLKKVFDAFWSTKPGGMGIGLAICQSIVAAHHGSLMAVNNHGGGSTFFVTLPVRAPA